MQRIVSKGKDINEAIQLGLQIMESTKKEVDIEILQYESKGFMGIGSKEAIVKLTKVETIAPSTSIDNKNVVGELDLIEKFINTPDIEIENLPTRSLEMNMDELVKQVETDDGLLEGKVWVKNGQLYCKSSPNHFPLVTVNDGIKLYKNNQLVKEKTTIISEKDFYEIKINNEEKATTWNVAMDQHKLEVHLHVEPGYKMIRSIPDIKPNHHIELIIEEKKEIHNSLNYNEIVQKLESLRVKHGFNQDQIIKALEVTEPSTFEIATGIKAKPGKDGWVELKVNMDASVGPKEIEDGRVDFREIKTIPAIERGKVIAIVHPPIPGQIGYTVTNEPLPAKQTLPIIIKADKGVMVVDDKIVATESGRPKLEQRGQLLKVSIIHKLTHNGNVDLSSGNIRFMGDVEIVGEVGERMVVEAEGDISVHKTVNMASLTASGAIVTFGNVMGSALSAGKNNMLIVELGHLIGIINQDVEKIIELIKQLTISPAFKSSDFSRGGLQPLIRILLEKRFKSFPPLAKKYVEIVRRGEAYLADDVWREVGVSLTHLFLSLTNEVTSLERIIHLSQKMKELYEFSKTPVEPDSYITIPNALNSRLYCSGNVLILGQGSINTKIHAGGALKVSGIIRGGEVYGRLGVEINEVGSESGTSTVIAVPNDQIIQINKVLEGTIIKIGNIKHTFTNTRYKVNARLNEDGRLLID